MGEIITLEAGDGHELRAYESRPDGPVSGGLVIVQEIFGLTRNIRQTADRFAGEGFHAIAPAYFDRVERDLVLDYSEVERGRATMQQLAWPDTLADTTAAIERFGNGVAAGVVGFCWGGTVAHVAAAELPLAAAVSYYGTGVARMLDREPRCPIMYHFGDRDQSIPPEAVERIRAALPEQPLFVYPGAGHGFSCADRGSYSEPDATLAFERTLSFLRKRMS